MRGCAGPDSDVVGDPGEDLVELASVLLVDIEIVIAVEGLILRLQWSCSDRQFRHLSPRMPRMT